MQQEWTGVNSATFTTGNNSVGFACVSPQVAFKTLPGFNGWVVNASLKTDTGGTDTELFRITDSSGTSVISLVRRNDGTLSVVNVNGVGTLTDTSVTVPIGTYYAIDFGFFYAIAASASRIEVRLNGSRINALTSSAYSGGLVAGFNMSGNAPHRLHMENATGNPVTYDYIGVSQDTAAWADAAAYPMLGVRSKFVKRPNAIGATYGTGSSWAPVPSGAGANVFNVVDETIANDSTDYDSISTLTGGGSNLDRVSWGYSGLPAGASSVAWVCHKQQLASSPSGTNATVNGFERLAGANTEETSLLLPSTGAWTIQQANYDLLPGAALVTVANVDLLEGGVRLTALS
jgi:hypothetical protein